MLTHPNVHCEPTRDLAIDADVVVVGSGAGGAVFASELAEAGLKVVVLEKGGHYDRQEFDQREATMLPLLYEDGAARTTKDGGLSVLHASCVGGTTVVNNAICFEPPAFVLERWADEHGVVGLSPQALASAIDKVKFVLNVQPIRAGELNENARLMKAGAEKLGMKGAAFQHNRTGCTQSGFCMVGCSYDRKQSMLITYVPRALHFGAQLYPFATAERVVANGRRVESIEGTIRNHKTRQTYRFRARAKVFAIAGGAISTPLLLLKSGVANASGMVGQNLRLHPIAPAYAVFAHEVKAYEGIPQGYYVDQFLPGTGPEGGFLLESIFSHPGLAAATIQGIGDAMRRMMLRYNHLAAAYVQVLDSGGGHVSVGDRGAPVIDYQLGAMDEARIRTGYKHLARVFLAAGAEQVQFPHVDMPVIRKEDEIDAVVDGLDLAPCKLYMYSAHQMGTCAMGADPRTHVLDSTLRAHDHDNLFVTDASAFPTAVGVNPQITIATLATHAARHVAESRATYLRS